MGQRGYDGFYIKKNERKKERRRVNEDIDWVIFYNHLIGVKLHKKKRRNYSKETKWFTYRNQKSNKKGSSQRTAKIGGKNDTEKDLATRGDKHISISTTN